MRAHFLHVHLSLAFLLRACKFLRYKFAVEYKKGKESAQAYVKVTVVPGLPPIVKLKALKNKKMNVNQKVVLKGYVESRTSEDIDVWWDCVEDEGSVVFLLYS